MILLSDLAPEEREYITQVGKISKPFAQDFSKAPVISRLILAVQRLTSEYEVNGVDISVWQGDVDFSALKEKAQFVIIRYGIGNDSIDSKAEQNVKGAYDSNMPYSGYWYLKPAKAFDKHAESFINAVDRFGGQLYPVSDFEENGGLLKSKLDSWLQKYFNILFNGLVNKGLIKESYEHMWYTSKNVVDNLLPKPNGWMRESSLDIAHWTTALNPVIPYEYEVCNKTWTMWQHAVTISSGYGVESVKIDLQRYNGTTFQFNLQFGTNISLPTPPIENPQYVIPTTNLNTRTSPIITPNNIIGVANTLDRFEYLEEEGDWTAVKVYLASRYLRKE